MFEQDHELIGTVMEVFEMTEDGEEFLETLTMVAQEVSA